MYPYVVSILCYVCEGNLGGEAFLVSLGLPNVIVHNNTGSKALQVNLLPDLGLGSTLIKNVLKEIRAMAYMVYLHSM